MNLKQELTIIVKTFMRENALKRLLRSIEKTSLRECKIVIADDSEQSIETKLRASFPTLDMTYLHLPFDSGLSRGRNAALAEVETPYFLLCDDDFALEAQTDFEQLLSTMRTRQLDIMGGAILNYPIINRTSKLKTLASVCRLWKFQLLGKAEPMNYLGFVNLFPDYWEVTYYRNRFEEVDSDVVLNFFIGRTEVVKSMGGWNDKLKIGEHLEFFVRFKQAGYRVGFASNFLAYHYPERFKMYDHHRERGIEFFKLMIEEHQIKRLVSYYPEQQKKESVFFDTNGEFVHLTEDIKE